MKINNLSTIVTLAASTPAATDLLAAVDTQLLARTEAPNPSLPISALTIFNSGAATCYVRTAEGNDPGGGNGLTAAFTGVGITIAPGESYRFPLAGDPDDTMGYECADAIEVGVEFR